MGKTVCLIGTFDTKGLEFQFLKNQIESEGISTLTINAGILSDPLLKPDISAEDLARASGTSLDELRQEADRGNSIATMAEGAAKIVTQLWDAQKINSIISLGGSAGTTIATTAMRTLPVGTPKVMVSTLASGDTSPYVGTKDITMVYSVVDIAGINSISRQILTNAANAIAGMTTKEQQLTNKGDKPLIAATMFGVTTPCVTKARETLEKNGYEVLVFHATGTGGRAMEDLIRSGFIAGVLDATTTELADELVGGILSAGPHRLEAAGEVGIPQVIAPGALDMVNFAGQNTIPEKFQDRTFYQHNPTVTLMRTTVEENANLGEIMAKKLNRAKSPTTILIPSKGVSAIDKDGQPFHDPEAIQAWTKNLQSNLDQKVNLIETQSHINDDEFAEKLALTLLEKLKH